MKKIISFILLASAFAFSDVNHVIENGVLVMLSNREDGGWSAASGVLNSPDQFNYEYDVEKDSIYFWRDDGTLLFAGKITSGGYHNEEGYYVFGQDIGSPTIRFDGYCYDSTGLKRVKHVSKVKSCNYKMRSKFKDLVSR